MVEVQPAGLTTHWSAGTLSPGDFENPKHVTTFQRIGSGGWNRLVSIRRKSDQLRKAKLLLISRIEILVHLRCSISKLAIAAIPKRCKHHALSLLKNRFVPDWLEMCLADGGSGVCRPLSSGTQVIEFGQTSFILV